MPGSRRSAFHPTKREQENQLAADLVCGGRWVEASAPKSATNGNNHQGTDNHRVPHRVKKGPSTQGPQSPQILDELLTAAGNPLPVGQLREVAVRHGLTIKSTAKADILVELDKKMRAMNK